MALCVVRALLADVPRLHRPGQRFPRLHLSTAGSVQCNFLSSDGDECVGLSYNQWLEAKRIFGETDLARGRGQVRERTIEELHRTPQGLGERGTRLHGLVQVNADDLRVVFRIKAHPALLVLPAQLVVIGDMAIVRGSYVKRTVRPERLGVTEVNAAFGRQARVGDGVRAVSLRDAKAAVEVVRRA